MNQKEPNNLLLQTKKKSWIKFLYTFFVVAIPAILIWLFFSNEFGFSYYQIEYGYTYLIALLFLVIEIGLASLLIYLKILDIAIMSFVIPVSISFMVIYVSYPLVAWARVLIIIPCIFLVIPSIYYCHKIELKMKIKQKRLNRK